ncbi:MAG: VCBS repeat-containing protein, partial [Rhodospirillales bacterium]|nr:VCBS repeat-containing protein [Acetobacter sp.]
CGCKAKEALPAPGSKLYTDFVSAFYVGLAGLQVGDDVRAEKGLAESTKLAAGEPAAWVNWGILALRQRRYEAAAERLGHARSLAPSNSQISYLLGLLESERGNSAQAITDLQQSVSQDNHNLRAMYLLATEVERQGGADGDAHFEELMRQILAVDRGNLAAELELSRVAAKRGDVSVLKAAVERLSSPAQAWPPEVKEQLAQLQAAVKGPQPRSAATRSIFLRNVLMRVPAFRDDLGELRPAPGEGAQPMSHFLRVANPPSRPAPADSTLRFDVQTSRADETWSWAGALFLNGDDAPVLAQANASHLHLANGTTLPFPGGSGASVLQPESVLPIDFNYDFKTDLVLAGGGGIRLYRQEQPSSFTDVTASTKLPAAVLRAAYTGAWALDVEADGDLDVLLGAPAADPTLLRNNGDGTFTPEHPFAGVAGLQQFTWTDLNGDGNPDAAMLDGAGHLHIFLNHRSGSFREVPVPASLGMVKAITAADVSSNDVLVLLAVENDGRIVRLSSSDDGQHWEATNVVKASGPALQVTGNVRLYAEDLDNNGGVDLILAPVDSSLSHAVVWLQGEGNAFGQLPTSPDLQQVFTTADLKQDGHVALVG